MGDSSGQSMDADWGILPQKLLRDLRITADDAILTEDISDVSLEESMRNATPKISSKEIERVNEIMGDCTMHNDLLRKKYFNLQDMIHAMSAKNFSHKEMRAVVTLVRKQALASERMLECAQKKPKLVRAKKAKARTMGQRLASAYINPMYQ